jgi:hypothetical protein
MKKFWSVTNEDLPEFEYMRTGNIGAPVPWEGSVHYEDRKELGRISRTPTEWTLGFMVDHNTWRWAKNGDFAAKQYINECPEKVGYRFAEHFEEQRASFVNNGFDGTILAIDGVTLFSASHTIDDQTNSNLFTTPVSVAAIEAGRLRGRGTWLDDKGKMITARLTGIISGVMKESEIRVLTGTEKKPGSNHNDINELKLYGGFDVTASEFITSSLNWIMYDPFLIKKNLLWNNNTPVTFDRDNDFDTKIHKFSGQAMYAKIVLQPYFAVGFNVDGA